MPDYSCFDGSAFIDRYGTRKPPVISKTDLDLIHTLISTKSHVVGPFAAANCSALKTVADKHNGANADSLAEQTRTDQEAAVQFCLTRAASYPRTAAP